MFKVGSLNTGIIKQEETAPQQEVSKQIIDQNPSFLASFGSTNGFDASFPHFIFTFVSKIPRKMIIFQILEPELAICLRNGRGQKVWVIFKSLCLFSGSQIGLDVPLHGKV